MPLPIHMYCTAKKQGEIKGDCEMKGREGSIEIQAMLHRIFLAHNSTEGRPTGKRKHAPIMISKKIEDIRKESFK